MTPKAPLFRPSREADGAVLLKWLSDPDILYGFPMEGEAEIEDSVRIWMGYAVSGSGLTALWNGEAAGMAVLYIQPFKKLSHTCLFSIIVDPGKRNLGIGTALLTELTFLARDSYRIENLHLEVYEGNPAKRLYERAGFLPFGKHPRFAKEQDGMYRDKICMQKKL